MAFSGGVYTLPTPALVPGQIVSSSENNTVRNDMAASFNLTWLRNGTAAATANIPMGSFKLTGLGAATTNGDALSYGAAAVVTTLTSTSLTATRVPYAGTGGLLQDASTFTFDGTTLTAGGFTTSGAISAGTITASGAITVSGGTANGVAYLNGSKVLTTGSALTFDGATLKNTNTSSSAQTNAFSAYNDTGIYTAIGQWGSASGSLGMLGASSSYLYTTSADLNLMANNASGVIKFAAGGTSESMRLTSTGLGIGTSSPAYKLDVSSGSTATTNNSISLAAPAVSGADNVQRIGLRYLGSSAIDAGIGLGYSNLGSSTASYINFGTSNGSSYSEKMRLDSSGNLGLGVTPSAWETSSYKALDVNTAGVAIYAGSSRAGLTNNAYLNTSGVWTYKGNGYATRYQSYNGENQWFTAPSGTAGNAISFTQAMTLDASGNLGVGTSTAPGPNGGGIAIYRGDYPRLSFRNSTTGDTNGVGTTMYQIGNNWEMYNNQAGYVAFGTNAAERMRIDSSGNVGIGTSSPSYKLDSRVAGATAGNFQNTTATSTTPFGNVIVRIASNGSSADATLQFTDSVTYNAYIGAGGGNLYFASNNGTERMRIDSSGNLLVGLTSPSYSMKLGVNGGIFTRATQFNIEASNSSTNFEWVVRTGSGMQFYVNSATVVASLSATGVWTNASDARYKENIRDINYGLNEVMQLQPRTYNLIGSEKQEIGFIAQEIQTVLPELVDSSFNSVTKEERLTLSYGQISSVLVKAIQELSAQQTALKAELDATKAEVAALKAK